MGNEYFTDGKLNEEGKKQLVAIIKLQEEAVNQESQAKKKLSEANELLNNLFGKPKGASLSWHDVIKSLL